VQRLLRIIQQRKLDRVAAAYGVAAWLAVQAASIALPTFGAPPWALKILIVAAICGFPLALWIAWHLTPAPHYKYGAPPPSKGTDLVLLGFMAAVVFLTIAELCFQFGVFPGLSPVRSAAADRAVQNSSPSTASVAVLPFMNMSGDPSKEYFSDGISEELLNQLANIRELRVAARTSSFAFKGKNQDIRSIARALNVRAVLEGSVREDGQHIRITAQLINAADGYHLWSKTYDRDLRNILSLQDEIARAITASLTHSLLGDASKPATNRVPIDPDAYRKYLEGQSFSARKTDEDDAHAIELLKQVTTVEPAFAPGFAALGRTYIHMAQFQRERGDLVPAAQTALNEALRLDPHNLEALSLHLILALMKWDWQKAEDDAHKLQSLNPRSVFTLRAMNDYYGSLGFSEPQSAMLREATRLDPLSFVDLNNLATVYNSRGEYAEAASAADDALALRPNRALALYTLCLSYVGAKRSRDAQALIAQLLAQSNADASQGCALKNAAAAGNRAEARMLAAGIAKRFPAFVYDETDIGGFYLAAGDTVSAMIWFDRAYVRRNQDLLALSYSATTPPTLLNLPAWNTLRQRPEARAWQAAHDRLAAELAGG
jgi:adenylate cyclase